jgi:hypothetical protein
MSSDFQDLNFSDVADFIRAWASISPKRKIEPAPQFEPDLGVNGDDGSDLLEAAEKHFAVNLNREVFGPHEYLFNAEGWGIGAALITLFTTPSVRKIYR